MNLELYLEKAMRKAGFHKYLTKEHMSTIRRVRLEADMGELSRSEALIIQACETPLDYGKAFLRLLCTSGLSQDYFGFSTRHLFTPYIKKYLEEIKDKDYISTTKQKKLTAIPGHQVDQDMAVEMVNKHGIEIRNLPEGCIDEELILKLVGDNPRVIERVPKDLITEKVALTAVARNGSLLWHIPEPLKSETVSIAAFKNDPGCFFCFPKKFVNSEIAEKAVMRDPGYIDSVPADMVTREMALHVAATKPRLVTHIPEHYLTETFYLEAVSKNHEVFKIMPESMHTAPGMIEQCIQLTKGKLLNSLRIGQLTDDRIKACLDFNFMLIKEVPSHLISPDIAVYAAALRGEAVLFLPTELITAEVVTTALKSFPYALLKLPQEALTDEIVMAAVKEDYKVFATLPKERVTVDVLTEAIRQNGALLAHVNEEMRTPELCLIALERGADGIPFIPVALRRDRTFMRSATAQLDALGLGDALQKKRDTAEDLAL